MNLKCERGRGLRGAAVLAVLLCAIAGTEKTATASLVNLEPLSLHNSASYSNSAFPSYSLTTPDTSGPQSGGDIVNPLPVALSSVLVSTSSINVTDLSYSQPYTTSVASDGYGATLYSSVEEDDPDNPYVVAGNAAALTFIYSISNSSTVGGVSALTLNGFGPYDNLWYGTYTQSVPVGDRAPESNSPSLVDLVYTANPVVIGFTIGASGNEALSHGTTGETATFVLYTNATQYGLVWDPVTFAGIAANSGLAYMPTPEPSSWILASIGMIVAGAAGWRRRR